MFKNLEKFINRSPFYNFIRYNRITDTYIELTKRKTKKAIAFYSSFLDPNNSNKLIFDVGANKGNKVKAFVKMGFQVIAVEPEKKSLSTLRYRYSQNKKVTIIDKGVSDQQGMLKMHIADDRSGLNTLSDKWVDSLEDTEENRWHKQHAFKNSYEVNVTTLKDLFNEYGLPYYLKIDVEGFEVNVIRGMNRTPEYISFETNLPEFIDETKECIERITALSPDTIFNYSIKDELELKNWAKKEEMLAFISNPAVRYMEIIAKQNNSMP